MRVLIFCAHPDDEVIGMGGTIRRLADAGAEMRLVIFSAGAEGYSTLEEADTITARREREVRAVCGVLGIQDYVNLGLLDWNLQVNNATYRAAVHHIRDFRPDVVFSHYSSDYNDHQAVSKVTEEAWFHAALPCALKEGEPHPMAPLYQFEVLHRMPLPSLVVDVTDTYAAKVEAMKCYASQFDIVGSPFQMMEGRALERGYAIGVKYGEAFARSNYRPAPVREIEALVRGW